MDTHEFILIHEGKQVKFTGKSIGEISARVIRYLGNYEQKFDTNAKIALEQKIANQIKISPLKSRRKKIPKLSEAFHASLALFKVAGGKTVDQKELDKRSAICLNCPVRAQTSFCAGCGGLGKATLMLNEARRLTKQLVFNAKLKTEFCGVCSCSLPLLLATDKESLPKDDALQEKTRPKTCWINNK